MDKSGRRFVVHFQLIEQPKNLAEKTNQKTRNYNLDLSSQRGHAMQLAVAEEELAAGEGAPLPGEVPQMRPAAFRAASALWCLQPSGLSLR